MREVNLSAIILSFLFLSALLVSSVLSYKLYNKGRLDFLVFNKISVFSEVPGVKAEFNNKAELETLLDTLGFWQGVTPDNSEAPRNLFKPKKVIVHITDTQHTDWFRDADGGFLASSWAEGSKTGTFHLHLGFNRRLFEEKLGEFDRLIDFMVIEAIYERTRDIAGIYGQEGVELRNAKLRTEPYIKLTKN